MYGGQRESAPAHTTTTADGEGGWGATGPMKLSTQTRGVQSTARDVCVLPVRRRDQMRRRPRVEQTDNANTNENLF